MGDGSKSLADDKDAVWDSRADLANGVTSGVFTDTDGRFRPEPEDVADGENEGDADIGGLGGGTVVTGGGCEGGLGNGVRLIGVGCEGGLGDGVRLIWVGRCG